MALAAQVEQTAGGSDEEVATLAEGGDLRAFADAAVAGSDDCTGIAGVGGDVLGDLDDQFAGRGQNEATDTPLMGVIGRAEQAREQRQREGGRLTGTRLGNANDVEPLDDRRDGGLLNRRGFSVTLVGDRFKDGGV